jgi:hypothetical protein
MFHHYHQHHRRRQLLIVQIVLEQLQTSTQVQKILAVANFIKSME